MLKHLTLIVELIQQKRKFVCNYGTVIAHVNNATALVTTGGLILSSNLLLPYF